jgi:hypothetical protein
MNERVLLNVWSSQTVKVQVMWLITRQPPHQPE